MLSDAVPLPRFSYSAKQDLHLDNRVENDDGDRATLFLISVKDIWDVGSAARISDTELACPDWVG